MALQTANQFNLNPSFAQPISTGMQLGNQINHQFNVAPKIEELSKLAASGDKQALAQLSGIAPDQATKLQQFQQTEVQGQRDKLLFDTKSVIQGAAQAKAIADPKARLNFLKSRREEILSRKGDPSHTEEAIALYESGDIEGGNNLIDRVVDMGVQSGILKPQGAQNKTASSKDLETLKRLRSKAEKTKDPIDIQLAEQFGRQAGFVRETPQELAEIEVSKESKKALVKQAATASKEAFDNLKKVRTTVANIDDAIKALDKGASTGPIISKLPNFREASIELNNIKGKMGLDVVGATTFGALSESELAFALDTALPDNLEPAPLKDWLIRKKDAQTKLANELRKAASFLGTPGNTIADYIKQQEKENPRVEDLSDDELFN